MGLQRRKGMMLKRKWERLLMRTLTFSRRSDLRKLILQRTRLRTTKRASRKVSRRSLPSPLRTWRRKLSQPKLHHLLRKLRKLKPRRKSLNRRKTLLTRELRRRRTRRLRRSGAGKSDAKPISSISVKRKADGDNASPTKKAHVENGNCTDLYFCVLLFLFLL